MLASDPPSPGVTRSLGFALRLSRFLRLPLHITTPPAAAASAKVRSAKAKSKVEKLCLTPNEEE